VHFLSSVLVGEFNLTASCLLNASAAATRWSAKPPATRLDSFGQKKRKMLGLPSSSGSVCTRCLLSARRLRPLRLVKASGPMLASPLLESWPLSISFNEAESSSRVAMARAFRLWLRPAELLLPTAELPTRLLTFYHDEHLTVR